MSNTYPNEVCFLLANDSIQEADTNKITLVGFYAGDDIVIKDESPGKLLGQIVIIAKLRGGSGQYKGKLKLIGPEGELIFEDNNKSLNKKEGENLIIGIKISPFPVKEFGHYKYTVLLDDKEYCYDFEIRNS